MQKGWKIQIHHNFNVRVYNVQFCKLFLYRCRHYSMVDFNNAVEKKMYYYARIVRASQNRRNFMKVHSHDGNNKKKPFK